MKTFLKIICITALISLTACKTITPQSVEIRTKAITYVATASALTVHPEYKPALKIASASFLTLSVSTNIDLTTIMALVQNLPFKELSTPQANIIVNASLILLQDTAGQLSITQPEQLRSFSLGAHEGIDMALLLSGVK